MIKSLLFTLTIFATIFLSANFISCSKATVEPTAVVTCANKTIVIAGSTTAAGAGTSNNGTIAATATGSTGFTFSLNTGAFQATGNFAGLAANTYTITAKDDAGCTSTKSFVVTVSPCPTIIITATTTSPSSPTATNGAITATASGGISPYTYSLNGAAFQALGTFANLAASGGTVNYAIVAKDVNGCLSASTSFFVNTTPCPTITISNLIQGSDKCTNNTGRVTITAAGSTGFTYSFNGSAYSSINIFSTLAAGNFTIGAKDANGCVNTATVSVPVAAAGPTFTVVKICWQLIV